MGRHDTTSHFLHLPKQLKFKQFKPTQPKNQTTVYRSQKLGALNRRG